MAACSIIAISATLTSDQIDTLQKDYMHGEKWLVVIVTKGVYKGN